MNTWGRCEAVIEGVVSVFGRRSFDERCRQGTLRVVAAAAPRSWLWLSANRSGVLSPLNGGVAVERANGTGAIGVS